MTFEVELKARLKEPVEIEQRAAKLGEFKRETSKECTGQQHVAVRKGMDTMHSCDANRLSSYNSLTTGGAIQDVGSDKGCCKSV
jgi:hypothetical protein